MKAIAAMRQSLWFEVRSLCAIFSVFPVSEANNDIRLQLKATFQVVKYLGHDIYVDIIGPNDALLAESPAKLWINPFPIAYDCK